MQTSVPSTHHETPRRAPHAISIRFPAPNFSAGPQCTLSTGRSGQHDLPSHSPLQGQLCRGVKASSINARATPGSLAKRYERLTCLPISRIWAGEQPTGLTTGAALKPPLTTAVFYFPTACCRESDTSVRPRVFLGSSWASTEWSCKHRLRAPPNWLSRSARITKA